MWDGKVWGGRVWGVKIALALQWLSVPVATTYTGMITV